LRTNASWGEQTTTLTTLACSPKPNKSTTLTCSPKPGKSAAFPKTDKQQPLLVHQNPVREQPLPIHQNPVRALFSLRLTSNNPCLLTKPVKSITITYT